MKRSLAMLLGASLLLGVLGLLVAGPSSAASQPRTRCIPEVPGLAPHGATGGRDVVLMIHGWLGKPDRWTEEITLAVNRHNRPHGRSLVEQVKRFGDTDVWLLDYHDASTRWVTDPAVGGVVADAIDCLADTYERPVGIVAHSMGGLAVRQVASVDDRADRIAAVVTFGTPHTGSDVAKILAELLGLGADPWSLDLVRPAHVQLLRTCGLLTSMQIDMCSPLPEQIAAFDSEAGRALRSGSTEIGVLPSWPPDLPTQHLAGDIDLVAQASLGLFYQDLGRVKLGDVVVSRSSAVALGSEQRSWDCRYNLRTGFAPGDDLRRWLGFTYDDGTQRDAVEVFGSPCAHWRLSRAMEMTNAAIGFLHEHLRGDGDRRGDGTLTAGEPPREVAAERPVDTAESPLMIVIDVSGSMREDDGTGTVRLDGAKSALTEMLFELRPGTPVGVRTYPDPGGPECNGGRALQPVEPLDATRTTALIDTLTAEWNTPTGPALLAAVDELRAVGYTTGEIVLVSDGESNCGPPPCEVAHSIVEQGFDVSVKVNTLGFQTSEAGRDELSCIAGATGGAHFDADDSEELTERLVALSGASLEVTVDHPASVPSGLRLPIEVSVTNTSTMLAQDVHTALAFDDGGAGTVLPAVLPPRYRLGNVPPGETVTRTWEVVAGATGQAGTAAPRVTVWGSALEPVTATSELSVTADLPGLEQAGEVLRRIHDNGGRVAILGDSFSSGEGAGTYLEGTDEPENRCHRSDDTYAVALFGTERTDIIACSGAVIQDLEYPQGEHAGTPAQLAALAELPERPDLVLLTIGGNDIDFKNIIRRCLRPDDCTEDHDFVYRTLRDIELLVPQLERAYRGVAQALDGHGTVAAVAYPALLPYRQSASCAGFTAKEIVFANHLARELNAVIERAARNVRAQGWNVVYVPHTAQAVLPTNTACHPDPYINPIDLLLAVAAATTDWATGLLSDLEDRRWWRFEVEHTARVQELMHPSRDGYRAMTHSLVRWSQTADTLLDDELPPTPTDRDIIDEVVGARTGSTLRVELTTGSDTALPIDVRQGDRIELLVDGFAPGSPVMIRVESRPIALASVVADAEGAVATAVHVPSQLSVGVHALTATGIDPDLEARQVSAELAVRLPVPGWVLPASIAGAVAGILGVAGLAVAVRRRRDRSDPVG